MDEAKIRRTLYVVSTLGFLHMFGNFALIPILSLFMVDLGATVLLVGVIYPILSIVHFSLGFLTGSLSDAFGRIPLIKIGMLIFSVSCLLGYFALDVWWVLILLVMMGIAMAFLWPTIHAAIADLFPPREMGEAIGKMGAISFIGMFIGPLVTAILIETVGYRGMFLISFLTGLVGFAASFLLTKESSMTDSSVKGKKFIAEIRFFPEFFRNRGVLSPSLAAFFYSFSIAVVQLYYPLIASDRGLSISEISITMMLWNSSFILTPFIGRLSDRIGRVLPIVASLWGACLLLLVAYFAQGFTAFATLLFLLGITRNTLMPVTIAQVAEESEVTMHGAGLGVRMTLNQLGKVISYGIMALTLTFGTSTVFRVAALGCLIGSFIYTFTLKYRN